jgi:hypothetical protein
MTKSVVPSRVAQPLRPAATAGPRRWLLLVHQLPPHPSNLRVRTWRRLQELGAVAVKQSVYVLPDNPEAREDFEWLKVEIEGAGGEVSVYSAEHLDTTAEASLIEEFRRARQVAYAELAAELQRLHRTGQSRSAPASRRRDLIRYRQRFAAIERIDFYGSAGRDRVVSLLAELEGVAPGDERKRRSQKSDDGNSQDYSGRLWVTRPRPGVDRMASAWLIRRFIDATARFGFLTDVKAAPVDALPFDMFGAGFGHEGDRCTFETLVARFDIDDAAVTRLAAIVHDLDLKDGKFGAPEAATLGATIDGLQLSCPDDQQLLEHGRVMFEALYRSFSDAVRPPRPRAVAPAKRRSARKK